MRAFHTALVGALALTTAISCRVADEPMADLIVQAAGGWTGSESPPRAAAVAVRGARIVAVGGPAEVEGWRGPETTVLEYPDGFLLPGFIDNHTHFNRAGELILGVNLLDMADEAALVRRVREARDRLPAEAWIVGGDWGAYEAWAQGSVGRGDTGASPTAFVPHRSMIDSITPQTPMLLSRWDRSIYLANGRALDLAGASCRWTGVDCDPGRRPTGRLTPAAAERIRAVIPPKSMAQRLAEARAALERLRAYGVTTIHDITPPEQMRVYQELRDRGELTVRVYGRPTLDRWDELAAVGVRHGFGDVWIRIGGLKGFVDGIMGNSSARFYEPYLTSGERGRWRDMMNPPGNMSRLLIGADSSGHWPQVHAIGDQAIDTLLDLYEHTMRVNGDRERRFRVIHAQVLRGPEVAERMARLGVIAEMQPYHAIDDMRWMEERIGDRSRWAYAFRTIHDAGVILSFGSDWPGTSASWYPSNPVLGIYAAVTRQTLEGEPEGGWFPGERIGLETALRAYTVNNAFAAGEEGLKGSLEVGKLADLIVLDRDPFGLDPSEIKDLSVQLTVVDGSVVYKRR